MNSLRNLESNVLENETIKVCVELYPPVKASIILYYWIKDAFPNFEICETCIEPDFVSQKNYEQTNPKVENLSNDSEEQEVIALDIESRKLLSSEDDAKFSFSSYKK